MSIIADFIRQLRRKPPIINTPWGPVSESARVQACANMNDNRALRDQILGMVVKECGGDAVRGQKEFSRRYPEVRF